VAIVGKLFETFMDATSEKEPRPALLPAGLAERWMALTQETSTVSDQARLRVVADSISSLTEAQAVDLFARVTGQNLGSVVDRLHL
jgi:dGTP triphosphohydrolase